MDQNDVLNALGTLDAILRQYEADVPEDTRLEERSVIQARLDQFLQNTWILLPPSPRPAPSKTCPVCKGVGKI
jgi:hypothetical protein